MKHFVKEKRKLNSNSCTQMIIQQLEDISYTYTMSTFLLQVSCLAFCFTHGADLIACPIGKP